MFNKKTTLVTDFLHGPIPLSPFEKRVISTQAYNRLHNILQNSTVYFTYPSNRTSRFSHSLGVVKIAGEMFRHGLLNANPKVLDKFFQHAGKAIDRIIKQDAFSADVPKLVSQDTTPSQLQAKDPSALACSLYSGALLPSLKAEKEYLFVVLYQAVRLVALLHDIGHPPFSHVTEYGLTAVYDLLDSQQRNAKAKKLHGNFKKFFGDGPVFHESLGHQLTEIILNQVIREIKEEEKGEDRLLYDLLLIKHLALGILRDNDDAFLACLHEVVDSDLDADRLDYVQRDLIASGTSRDPVRIERLVQSYTLLWHEESERFEFVPSIRALNTIEDFYLQRFQLYKYVVYHHRVVKFDALLQRSVYRLAKNYFVTHKFIPPEAGESQQVSNGKSKNTSKAQALDDVALAGDISGLWQVLDPQVVTYPSKFVNYYIQWDDSWLLTILRSHYFLLRKDREKRKGTGKSIVEIRLEELLSNKKRYHSLFKRGECFLEVDREFLKAFDTNFDWARFKSHFKVKEGTKVSQQVTALQKYVAEAKQAIQNNEPDKLIELIEGNGYVLARLSRLVVDLFLCGINELPFAETAAEQLREKFGLKDVILMPKRVKAGVTKGLMLADSEGAAVELGKVSRVADELERAALLFPPFFSFLYADKPLDEKQFQEYRIAYGKLLWEAFDAWVKIKYTKLRQIKN